MIPDNEMIIEDEIYHPKDEAVLWRIIFELLPKELSER
jgi:hypothetical protein